MLWVLLTGCSAPCDADTLGAGAIQATIDAEAWSSTALWSAAGDAAQLTTDADVWRISVVLYENDLGEAPSALDGDGPWTFPLGAGSDGGFALLYPEEGGSMSSEQGAGGSLELWRDGEDWLACFDVDVAASDGGSAVVSASVRSPAP